MPVTGGHPGVSPGGSEARKPGRAELGAGLFMGSLRCAWFFLVFPQISAKSFWKIPGWLSCAENRGRLTGHV